MSTKEKDRTPQAQRRTTAPQKRKSASAAPVRKQPVKPRPAVQKPGPAAEVVYLPPKPFNRQRLILRLATVVAVVLALLLGLSVFFKVDEQKVTVSGTSKYTAWDVFQASGIQNGENLLTFSRARAAAKIRAELPYVEEIRIGIKLPDTVMIEIVEVEVPYAVQGQDGGWWLISSSGKVIEKAADGAQSGYTRILGVQLKSPQSGEQAAALENAQGQTDSQGNATVPVITQAQRLETALTIAQYLEMNGIIGAVTTMDVNSLSDIQLIYGQQYQIKLGNDTQLGYKISCLKSVISDPEMKYQSGVVDISFTTWPDKVGFTPFDDGGVSIL